MEFFLKYKQKIFRLFGIVLFVGSLIVFFWAAPSKGISESEAAKKNIERMNAAVSGSSSSVHKKQKKSHTAISAALKETRKKQLRIFMLFMMFLGAASLLYSFFIKRK